MEASRASGPPASGPAAPASWRRHAGVIVLFGALAATLGHPVTGHLSTHLYGSVTEDGAINYWNTWHLGHALRLGQSPFLTDQIFYPMGTNLAFHNHTSVNGVICLVLEPLVGPLASTG